jgi:hypothetical protein
VKNKALLAGLGATAATGMACIAFGVTGGCASILSIPDRSPDWCNRPENAHDFCDDFDHDDAGGAWAPGMLPGATIDFTAPGDTLPNAVDLATTPQSTGVPTVSGIFKQFDNEKFDHVVVSAEVRFVDVNLEAEGGVESQLGFMLVQEQNFCVGLVATPNGIGIVYRANMMDCTSVANLPADAGKITDDAGLATFELLGPLPMLKAWVPLKLDIKRNADNSGTVAFTISYPGFISPPQIPPGYLTENSPPAVALATSVVGPSGHTEVQFDNVTVDFPKD